MQAERRQSLPTLSGNRNGFSQTRDGRAFRRDERGKAMSLAGQPAVEMLGSTGSRLTSRDERPPEAWLAGAAGVVPMGS